MCIEQNCKTITLKKRCLMHHLMHKHGNEDGLKKFKDIHRRLQDRYYRRRALWERNRWNKTWTGSDGRTMQYCDYFGTCESPCNGDC